MYADEKRRGAGRHSDAFLSVPRLGQEKPAAAGLGVLDQAIAIKARNAFASTTLLEFLKYM